MRKILQSNGVWKKAGVGILISEQAGFKPKLVWRDKEGYFILIKRIIQEKITIVNMCTPNTSIPNYIKETLLNMKVQAEVCDSNTLLTPMDGLFKQKWH
jgi:hypothetical protein